MKRTTIRARIPGHREEPDTRAHVPATPLPRRGARMLALAHHVEHLIETGVVEDYAAVARQLGLTRARMTQLSKLILLAPEVQEAVLIGAVPATERSLRDLVAEPDWDAQVALLPALPGAP